MFFTCRAGVENIVDLPEHRLNSLFGVLGQNGGRLSRRAKKEFAELTHDEVADIERLYSASFGEPDNV